MPRPEAGPRELVHAPMHIQDLIGVTQMASKGPFPRLNLRESRLLRLLRLLRHARMTRCRVPAHKMMRACVENRRDMERSTLSKQAVKLLAGPGNQMACNMVMIVSGQKQVPCGRGWS